MSLFTHINDLSTGQEKSQAIKQLIKEQKVSKEELVSFLNNEIKVTNSKTWLDQSNKILKWVHLNYKDPVVEVLVEDEPPPPIHIPKADLPAEVEETQQETIKKSKKPPIEKDSGSNKSMFIGLMIGLLFGLGSFAVYFITFSGFDKSKTFHELESVYKSSTRYDLLVEIASLKENVADLNVKVSELSSKDQTEFQKLLELAEEATQTNTILSYTKVIKKINLFQGQYPNSKYLQGALDKKATLQSSGATLAIESLLKDYKDVQSKLSISDISRLNKDIQFNKIYFIEQLNSSRYKQVVEIIEAKSSTSKKFEEFESEIVQLISNRNFNKAKTKLTELKTKNPNDNYNHLEEEILQSEMGNKLQFVDQCVAKAKKLRIDDEDDGNPYYQLQLFITLSQAGQHSIANEQWTEFNKMENYTFLMNYPEQFFRSVVQPMSKLKNRNKLQELLKSSEAAIMKMPLDSNGTKVLASIQLILAHNFLNNDNHVDSLLDQLIIKTEFFDVNTLEDLSLTILDTLKKLAKFHSVQVQKILPQLNLVNYPTHIALVLMQLGKYQEAFDMIPKYKEILLPKMAIGFADHSQEKFAIQCVDFIVNTEDEASAEIQKLIWSVSNSLSKNAKFEASIQLRSKLVSEANEWKIPYLALRVLNQQKYAIHKFQHGDEIRARSILKDNRNEINKLYGDSKFIRNRTLSIFNLAQSYYDIQQYSTSFELLNATLLLLENVPATEENLRFLSSVLFFKICDLYSKLLVDLQSGKIKGSSISDATISSRLKNTIVKMNRTYSSYNNDFIDSTLEIHKLAMYNLKVGLKVKFEEYMVLLENMGDERKLSIASNYWLKTAQTYLLDY